MFNSFAIDAIVYGEVVKPTDMLGGLFIIFFTLLNAILKCFGKANWIKIVGIKIQMLLTLIIKCKRV